jgi:hypothetical protein
VTVLVPTVLVPAELGRDPEDFMLDAEEEADKVLRRAHTW